MPENDLKQFIREITRRNEVVWRGVLVGLEENTRVLRALQDEIADQRAEIREQTRGLMAAIDRIFGGPDADS